MRNSRLLFFSILLIGTPIASNAQVLQLKQGAIQPNHIVAQVGDVVEIDVHVRLDSLGAAGMAFYLSIPDGPFEVVDSSPVFANGIQPFAAGELFQEGGILNNRIASDSDLLGPERQWMEYAVVLGTIPGGRSQKGNGVVASFKLRCTEAVDGADIRIDNTALRETRLVLPDGTGERQFVKTEGLQISVVDVGLGANGVSTATPVRTWGQLKGAAHD